jgi:hypothetical protein
MPWWVNFNEPIRPGMITPAPAGVGSPRVSVRSPVLGGLKLMRRGLWDLIDGITVRQYRKALLDLDRDHKITMKQKKVLCVHSQARNRAITANELARAVGWEGGYRAVNAQYGALAHKLWIALRLPTPRKPPSPYARWLGLLESGDIVPGQEWEGQMHQKVAQAVKQLPWCNARTETLHVLVGDAERDADLLLNKGRRHNSFVWAVPNKARADDRVVFFLHRHGFVAQGIVASEPKPRSRGPWPYGAIIRKFNVLHTHVPLAVVQRALPEWKWPEYPRSYTTLNGILAQRLQGLLATYQEAAAGSVRHTGHNGHRRGGFGVSPEENRRVEQAAIRAVTKEYESRGWKVQSKERERCGYDLFCNNGPAEEHVEVKGISGPECIFQITAGEVSKAESDPEFRLVAVTNAGDGNGRKLSSFTGPQFLRQFGLVPIRFMASPRRYGVRTPSAVPGELC